jgi:hypothetical protein
MRDTRQMFVNVALLALLQALAVARGQSQVIQDPPFGRPDAVIDLASRDGVNLVNGTWRYHDVKIVDADSNALGPDLKPSGAPIKTYDYEPRAGGADFNDSQWEAIDPTTLDQRRVLLWCRLCKLLPCLESFSESKESAASEMGVLATALTSDRGKHESSQVDRDHPGRFAKRKSD